MLITGSAVLNDNSRYTVDTGRTGFMFDIAPSDSVDSTALAFYGVRIPGDATYLQGQIIGSGDLTLELKNWIYYGGYQQPDTTWVNGVWMFQWYTPYYINYSIFYKPYDSSIFTLYGCPYRDPVQTNTGQYYASMAIPETPGHYEIRWMSTEDQSSLGIITAEAFTSVSRGIDPMADYPYAVGMLPYPTINPDSTPSPLVVTIPTYEYKNLGETAVFTLQFNGAVPTPITYHWRMNDNNLTDDATKFSGVLTDTLIIYNASMKEAGSFTCLVSSQVLSSKAWLVLDPP